MAAILITTKLDPIDIWRSAQLIVRRHGDLALIECALKADEMLENGDPEGQAVWLAIRRAAQSLLASGAPADLPTGRSN